MTSFLGIGTKRHVPKIYISTDSPTTKQMNVLRILSRKQAQSFGVCVRGHQKKIGDIGVYTHSGTSIKGERKKHVVGIKFSIVFLWFVHSSFSMHCLLLQNLFKDACRKQLERDYLHQSKDHVGR